MFRGHYASVEQLGHAAECAADAPRFAIDDTVLPIGFAARVEVNVGAIDAIATLAGLGRITLTGQALHDTTTAFQLEQHSPVDAVGARYVPDVTILLNTSWRTAQLRPHERADIGAHAAVLDEVLARGLSFAAAHRHRGAYTGAQRSAGLAAVGAAPMVDTLLLAQDRWPTWTVGSLLAMATVDALTQHQVRTAETSVPPRRSLAFGWDRRLAAQMAAHSASLVRQVRPASTLPRHSAA